MPMTRIEIGAGWIGERQQEMIEAVQAALKAALSLPDWDRDIVLSEHAHRIVPPGRSERYTRIEALMFAGRSLAAKRRLYAMICDNLAALGVPKSDVKIALVEMPRESWGIRGGQCAADVELGFEVEV